MLGSGHWWFPIKYEAVGSQARLFSDEALGAPWGHLWFPIPSISLVINISISLVPDAINIRSKKNAPRATLTQYGMTLGWNSKPPNVYMGGLMMCLQDESHLVKPSFCPVSILEAGWPIKPFNQWFCTSVIVGGPTQIISLPGLNR